MSLRGICLAACCAAILSATPVPLDAASGTKPNFVFFLVDDLGWIDIGCFGSSFYETPNLDKLAASGMKFTQGYAACPVCSPTRASIMTGRHPVRVDITDWIPGSPTPKDARFLHVDDRNDLDLKEVTIAEALKEQGYQTMLAGKWHLGSQGHWPTDQGFDVNAGGYEAGSPKSGYYPPWKNPNLPDGPADEYLDDRLASEVVKFIEHRDQNRPFYVYLPFYGVHTPINAYKPKIEHYQAKARALSGPTPTIVEHQGVSRARQDYPEYASMISGMDDAVGKVLGSLDRLGLADNTVVFFFSDNGGLCTQAKPGSTSNLPLRSGKGWLYEGGVREPMIVRAPGVTSPGSVCETPVVSMDFFPTILELAGLPARPDLHADGQSLASLLKGEAPAASRTFYWHYPHYHGSTWKPGASIRDGDWKLIEFYDDGVAELYNLKEDPYEQHEASAKHPGKAQELRAKLAAWQQSMHAKMPQPNPEYKAETKPAPKEKNR